MTKPAKTQWTETLSL